MTDQSTHPLNLADAERSAARVADVELGLRADPDNEFWRDVAETRIRALDQDEPAFGLLPHEEAERAKLKQLLAGQESER
jgi:hypothetical protein